MSLNTRLGKSTSRLVSFSANGVSIAIQLVLLLFTVGACAQATLPSKPPNSEEHEGLPADALGRWSPYSENYQRLGEFRVERSAISWGNCKDARYQLLRSNDKNYFIEVERSESCNLRGNFLHLMLSGKRLEVWICRQREQLELPVSKRICSWGILDRIGE